MNLPAQHFLAGGGEMGERIRAHDWERFGLGHPTTWPAELRTVVELMLASNQPMYVAWGPARTFLYNDHYAAILAGKHPSALGRDLLEVWPEIRHQLEPLMATVLGGEPVQVPAMQLMLERHGYPEETWFSFFFAPVRHASGGIAGMFGACSDITSQVQAEHRLAASEARHRGILANMEEAFVLIDRDFRMVEVNAEAERLIRRPREALVGHVHWDLFPGTHDSRLGEMYRRAMASGRPGSLEFFYVFPEGHAGWFDVRVHPSPEGLAVFFHDITRRRQQAAEAALSAERVELALDAGAIVGTWVWEIPDDRFVADERFAHEFGLDVPRCRRGLPLAEVKASIHPDDIARVEAAIADAMQRGGPYRCEYRVRQRDGAFRWIEAAGRVELDALGRAVRFPGVLIDRGEHRRVEAERDQALALLRTFIEAVPGVVYAKDLAGRLIIGNRGVAELLGMPHDAYLGRTDREVLADAAQAETVMATDRRIMASGAAEQVEEYIQRSDGSPAWWLSTKAPMRDVDGNITGLIGASIDITERKHMEQALRLSEQRNAMALEVAKLGTWTCDLREDTVALDARSRQICGLAPARERFGRGELADRVHPDDRARVNAAVEAAMAPAGDGTYAAEFRWVHADGRVVWTLARGQVEFAGHGAGRVPVSMVGSMLDVTERRRMLETLEEADRRKNEFLAMLAHELRNPLAPIGTAAQLLRMSPGDEGRVEHAAQIIARQVGHITRMVDDLLDVSRVTRGLVQLDRQPVDMRTILAAALEQAEPALKARGHALATETGNDRAVVRGDRHRLVQVVSNLLNNAAKYTPANGRITVSLSVDETEVTVRVGDNGIGMDERLVPQVFDLFTQGERTPDRSQGGLGIGLALVRSIVQMHGGRVFAHSPGVRQGSTFSVVLPREATAVPPAVEEVLPPRAAAPGWLLVVDDNRDAANTLADALRMLGHHVVVAGSGREALEVVSVRARWDALILDIGLPDMTGHELARRLRAKAGGAAMRIIALTGYGQEQDVALSRAAGFDCHLVKPADVAVIQRTLARMVAQAEPCAQHAE